MLIPIDAATIAAVTAQAMASPRKRAIKRYHEHPDLVQRMLNVIRPSSYVTPHRHQAPDKVEAFIILSGRCVVVSFDNSGEVTEWVVLEAGRTPGVEIEPRTWHMIICLPSLDNSPAVLYEVIEGPYDADSHKKFAPFAPPPDPATADEWAIAEAYIAQVLSECGLT